MQNNKCLVRFRLLALAFALALLSGCATYTGVREHPDFASAKRKVTTVAILPPDVEFTRIVFNGDNQRVPTLEKEATKGLLGEAATDLKEHGYQAQEIDIDGMSAVDTDVRFKLEQLRTAYSQAFKELYEKSATTEQASQYRVSVGPIVNPFATYAHADALLIMHYTGYEKSGGQVAKELAASVLFAVLTGNVVTRDTSGGQLQAALLDGTTGDVLWSNVSAGLPGASLLVKTAFGKLPDRSKPSTPPANPTP